MGEKWGKLDQGLEIMGSISASEAEGQWFESTRVRQLIFS